MCVCVRKREGEPEAGRGNIEREGQRIYFSIFKMFCRRMPNLNTLGILNN